MNHTGWVDPRIDRVRVADVRAYLTSHGWHEQAYPRPELLVFAGPPDDDGEPILQVLPSSERLRDYRMRLEGLLGALSVLEGRPAADVLTDVLRAAPENEVEEPTPSDGRNGAVREV